METLTHTVLRSILDRKDNMVPITHIWGPLLTYVKALSRQFGPKNALQVEICLKLLLTVPFLFIICVQEF